MSDMSTLERLEQVVALADQMQREHATLLAAGENLARENLGLREVLLRLDEELRQRPIDVGQMRAVIAATGTTPAVVALCRAAVDVMAEARAKRADEEGR